MRSTRTAKAKTKVLLDGADPDSSSAPQHDLPRFLKKTFELVSSPQVACIEWAPDGRSLIVSDPVELAADVLPKHFKHNKFSSFVRQLNTYGFRKIDTDAWQFANANFLKGKPDLLANIHRHKPDTPAQKGGDPKLPLVPPTMELVKLETENSTLKREMMEQRQQMAVMADSLAFLQQRQERSEEHQKQLMKFIAGVVGKCNVVGVVGGSQCQEGVYMSMGPQAKRQRFLEHCSEGAADSHVDNSCFSLPEVNEVNEVQSPLASADSLGTVDIPREFKELLAAGVEGEMPPPMREGGCASACDASPTHSVGTAPQQTQSMQPLQQNFGSLLPACSITESMLDHYLPQGSVDLSANDE